MASTLHAQVLGRVYTIHQPCSSAAMHPTLYADFVVEATKIQFEPRGLLGPQHRIKLTSADATQFMPLLLNRVHMSDACMQQVSAGNVTSLCTQYVPPNGLAASLLGSPELVITSLTLKSGRVVDVRPGRLKWWRAGGLFGSAVACVATLAWLMFGDYQLMAVALLVGATHLARTFLALPHSTVRSHVLPIGLVCSDDLDSISARGPKSIKRSTVELEGSRLPSQEAA